MLLSIDRGFRKAMLGFFIENNLFQSQGFLVKTLSITNRCVNRSEGDQEDENQNLMIFGLW